MKPVSKRIAIGLVLLACGFSVLLFCSLFLSVKNNESHDISQSGENYGGIYKRYKGSVYAAVPSNGYYKIDIADPDTFTLLPGATHSDHQVGKDKNHVYCGNRVIPGLDATHARVLGNNYFSDGKQSAYCSYSTTRNPELGKLEEALQIILHQWGYGTKPQSYLYPFALLPESEVPYRPLPGANLITDGTRAYYRGQLMEQADPAALRPVMAPSRSGERPSSTYFTDGRNVYHQAARLALAGHRELQELNVSRLTSQTPYLYDPHSGAVYAADLPFDSTHQPYYPLTRAEQHIYHLLFTSRDGLFYYDGQSGEVKRMGDNIFTHGDTAATGDFTALSPYIFWDGQHLLYLQASERWGSRRNPGLISRSTHIYQFMDELTGEWQKIGDVRGGVFGSLWQNGASLWYFDLTGDTLTDSGPIYRIADRETLALLQPADIGTSVIRKLVRNGKLTPPAHRELLQAKTVYRKTSVAFHWLFYGLIVLAVVGNMVRLWGKMRKR